MGTETACPELAKLCGLTEGGVHPEQMPFSSCHKDTPQAVVLYHLPNALGPRQRVVLVSLHDHSVGDSPHLPPFTALRCVSLTLSTASGTATALPRDSRLRLKEKNPYGTQRVSANRRKEKTGPDRTEPRPQAQRTALEAPGEPPVTTAGGSALPTAGSEQAGRASRGHTCQVLPPAGAPAPVAPLTLGLWRSQL